jgi:DNA-binding response OmpR family regulator
MRVLVVEDTPRMAALLLRGLTEEGYAVEVATNGIDAVWLATEQSFDAIVLDVVLPDIDGFEVCRRLRRSKSCSPACARSCVEARESARRFSRSETSCSIPLSTPCAGATSRSS